MKTNALSQNDAVEQRRGGTRSCDAPVAEGAGDASSPAPAGKPNGAPKVSRDEGVATTSCDGASQPRAWASAAFRLGIILAGMLLALPTAAFAVNAIEADLAMAYGPSGAAYFGGEDNIQVVVANCVAGNNLFNDQSGTGARMRIAGFFMSTNDPVNQDNGTVLGWVAGWGSNYDFSDVRNFGANVGADLVLWVSPNTGAAGNAYEPGVYSCIAASQIWAALLAHETGGHNYRRTHSDGVPNPKTIMLHNYCGGGGAAPPYFYSNPNIWFNGVQLLGDANNNCGMGALVNGGDNSNPTYWGTGAQAVADRAARVVTAPNLNNVVLRWMFTNAPGSAPASTTNYDLVSRAPAVVRGTGATYTGAALRIPGGTTGNVAMNSMSAYIDLPNGMISSRTNITIEIWATPLSAPNWARICDFGRTDMAGDAGNGEWSGLPGTAAPGSTSAYDDIMLSVDIGTDITKQRFESKLSGANTVTLDANLATTAGVQHHYAITFTDGLGLAGSDGGRWQWFRDGDAVASLDVTNHLSAIHDMNNWLGRSMYSGDNNGNNDYAEVRVSNVALSRNQILANYLLGPNYISAATVTLTNSDATSASSFAAAGQWSNGAAPSAGNSYETFGFLLGTPADGGAYTFGGDSLALSGGSLLWQGTSASTITVNHLTLNGATVRNAGSGACTLAGNVTATNNGALINAVNGAMTISAGLGGNGPVTYLANAVTLSGANGGFTGKTCVGNGQYGAVRIDSEARLGTNPAAFTPDQLTINRGVLMNTATFAISNSNRGICIGPSGATFNTAGGATLTLATPLSSQNMGSSIQLGTLTKTGAGTLILSNPAASSLPSSLTPFNGTVYADTGTNASDGVLRIATGTALANARSPICIRATNSSSSRLQLDGSSGNITLPQAIAFNGRTVSAPAVENLAGTNMIAGGLTLNDGGSYYQIQSDANSVLSLGGSISTAATSARTLTLVGSGNFSIPAAISDGSAKVNLTKSGSGAATLSGNDIYSGATTVSQGTLKLKPSTAVLHLTFDNPAGSSNGSVITNTGSAGSLFNGTIIGSGASIVTPSPVKFGNALNINGTGTNNATNIVFISNKVLNTDANNSWTVAFWVKTTTTGAVILYQGDGGWSSSGQTTFYLNAGSATTTGATHAGGVRYSGGWLTGTANVANGAWHHVALVDNAGTESIFVDGNVDAVTSTMGLPLASGANQIWIGGSPDTSDGTIKMNGQLDEIYMFSRALTRTEVQALVNNNNAQSTNAPVLPVTTPVSVASGATFDLGGMAQTILSLSGGGTVTNTASGAATLIVSNNSGSTFTFSGSIGDTSSANALGFVQVGSVTNIFSGANNYHGTTRVNGGALLVNGTSGSGLTTVAGGALLGGGGTVGGALTVQSGGTLSPGNGIGTLTVNGYATLQAGGTTVMEINKSVPANDQLIVGGALNYGGRLIVTNLGGTLAGGDSFTLFQAGSFNGSFASYLLPSLNAGLAWNTSTLSSGLLTVVQTTPTNLMWNVSSANLNLSWPVGYTGWRLQVQTNALNSGLGTNWVDVSGSSLTNNVSLPVDVNQGGVFYRLIYP